MLPDDVAHEEFYSGQEAEVADYNVSLLRPWSLGILRTKATCAPWINNEVPCSYILCEKDKTIKPSFQEFLATSGEKQLEIIRCDADHSPFLDRPDWVAKVIRRAAGESGIEL